MDEDGALRELGHLGDALLIRAHFPSRADLLPQLDIGPAFDKPDHDIGAVDGPASQGGDLEVQLSHGDVGRPRCKGAEEQRRHERQTSTHISILVNVWT